MYAYIKALRDYNDALVDGRLAGPNAAEIISILTEYTAIKDPEIYRAMTPFAANPDGTVNLSSLKKRSGVLPAAQISGQRPRRHRKRGGLLSSRTPRCSGSGLTEKPPPDFAGMQTEHQQCNRPLTGFATRRPYFPSGLLVVSHALQFCRTLNSPKTIFVRLPTKPERAQYLLLTKMWTCDKLR